MNGTGEFTSILSDLQEHASVASVYGAPIERNGRTVVPVAKIRYGFGGGYGQDPDDAAGAPAGEDRESTGAGMGGGVTATPTGGVEITDTQTRFIPIRGKKRFAVVAFACLALGYVFGRLTARGD